MDISVTRRDYDADPDGVHNRVYKKLAETLEPVRGRFPYGWESLNLLIDEIFANRFERDGDTRNVRIRLDVGEDGVGVFRVTHDGVDHDDVAAPRHSYVVEGIIRRLMAEYINGDVETQNHYTDNPKITKSIKFKLTR